MSDARFYLSPVDYEAWRKGYLPPSEHQLIDALAYRGARVVAAASFSDVSYWFVIKGELTPKQRAALRVLVRDLLDDDGPLDVPPDPEESGAGSLAEGRAGNLPPDEQSNRPAQPNQKDDGE